jgi:zinc transport system substrate-binding protein
MNRFERSLAAACAAACAVGSIACSPRAEPAPASGPLRVFVSIVPQEYFVERVGGPRVVAEALVGPGQSPETYEPSPGQMAGLEKARTFFRIGMPFENTLVSKLARMYPSLRMVDTRAGVPLRSIEGHRHGDDDHGNHHEGASDPHIWLAPALVKIQAATIRDELKRLDPDHAAEYDANCAAFAADLDRLDQTLAAILAPVRGRTMLVFHPSFGYFADAYGFVQAAVEVDGKEPGPRDLAAFVARAKEVRASAIFVQREFSPPSAEVVARELGGKLVKLTPLARAYEANLERMARAVAEALGAPAHGATGEIP